MTEHAEIAVGEADPTEAFATLQNDAGAALVDVRTRAEWTFVGLPDLSALGKQVWPVEWRFFPGMSVNPAFMDELRRAHGDQPPSTLFFLCRSGARSLEAARHAAAAYAEAGMKVRCVNVAEGFEGDLDAEGHRGTLNGWKARGLPWRQS
ncbi:sulfurtransferase [Oceanicella actignis]|uniref:Rhodanese-related sulfurtransferase n=1 Tax=Oceanicella actignis TaxID=1189325 RepID=A0A1M7SU95_9RHOB|nr:sulfurtransferase [Oceanicella actignis]TYO90683.1 thiosulfate sulfurtransferase [Oceanicella actignis]SES70658.1 thiosulfate sulfurtransferase [Oceanicella actignis]SHN61956.1 Rhodanese-related sulfurtransferase [Oceanicella actignis]